MYKYESIDSNTDLCDYCEQSGDVCECISKAKFAKGSDIVVGCNYMICKDEDLSKIIKTNNSNDGKRINKWVRKD